MNPLSWLESAAGYKTGEASKTAPHLRGKSVNCLNLSKHNAVNMLRKSVWGTQINRDPLYWEGCVQSRHTLVRCQCVKNSIHNGQIFKKKNPFQWSSFSIAWAADIYYHLSQVVSPKRAIAWRPLVTKVAQYVKKIKRWDLVFVIWLYTKVAFRVFFTVNAFHLDVPEKKLKRGAW